MSEQYLYVFLDAKSRKIVSHRFYQKESTAKTAFANFGSHGAGERKRDMVLTRFKYYDDIITGEDLVEKQKK